MISTLSRIVLAVSLISFLPYSPNELIAPKLQSGAAENIERLVINLPQIPKFSAICPRDPNICCRDAKDFTTTSGSRTTTKFILKEISMKRLSPAEYQAMCRHDLYTFTHRAFLELNRDARFLPNWHNELIASKLQACFEGKITRLIINVPPRSLKSHAASICLPAFVLGHKPSAQIICVSYGQELANKLALDCRTLMNSECYQSLFPVRLSQRKQSVQEFMTTANGFRLATSVGGVLTGRGSDIIIIDDPLKPDEAVSQTQRQGVNDWYDHTLSSRLNDKRTGCIIIIMQRLHEDDLVGHVVEREHWEWVRLPAVAEEDETHEIVSLGRTTTVRRRAGEALHPEREPLEVLENMRRAVGEYNFASQYQQEPAPLGGGMVKAEWFRCYKPGEEPARFDRIVQSWDTANKSAELNDYSACVTLGQKNRKIYLLHVLRRRMDYPDLKRAVRQQADRFRPTNILIEDKASGTQLIQELVRDGADGITRYVPTMDKVMRLHSVTRTIENGFVYLPTESDWRAAYVHELTTFPSGKYDDQADATSQALDWLKQQTHVYGVLDYNRQEMIARNVGLPQGFEFTQHDEDEEIVAANKTTGRKIRWTGQNWVDARSNTPAAKSEACPKCSGTVIITLGKQKRCQQCGEQWPPVPRVQQTPTRRDILNRTEF
jgi:predicted phage terminase large subunit-like protein